MEPQKIANRLGRGNPLFLGFVAGVVVFAMSGIYFWNQPCETAFWMEDGKRMENRITSWSRCEAGSNMLRAFTDAPRSLTDSQSSRLAWLKFATIGSIIAFFASAAGAARMYMMKDDGAG